MTRLPPHAAALGLAVAVGSCAVGPADAPVAPHGLASPSTPYLAHEEVAIRAHMALLADELVTLSGLTVTGASSDDAVQRAVLASLARIEARARRVGGGGAVTNYSVVNENMDGFLEDVALAREFAEREPANLVPANRLVHSCRSCHQSM